MKIDPHKETVATQPVSTTIDASVIHRDLSISQAIEQALADTSRPSKEQSLAESTAPKVDDDAQADVAGRNLNADFPYALSLSDGEEGAATGRGAAYQDVSADDILSAFEQGISVSDAIANADAADSAGTNATEDFSLFDAPSQAELEAAVRAFVGIGEENPDAPPPRHDEGMIAQGAGSALVPVRSDDEGLHGGLTEEQLKEYKGTTFGNIGEAIGNGLPSTPTGQALKQATEEINSIGKSDEGSSGGGSSGGGSSGGGSSGGGATPRTTSTTVKSEDGKIIVDRFVDGTIIVTDGHNGTTTTLRPDGSTSTRDSTGAVIDETPPLPPPDPPPPPPPPPPAVSQPGSDVEPLTPEQKAKLIETLGAELHIPTGDHSGDDIDYGEGDTSGPVRTAGGLTMQELEELKDSLIGDPGPDASVGASVIRPDPQAGGEIDPSDDAAGTPQGSGPEDDPLDQGPSVEASPPSAAEDQADGEQGGSRVGSPAQEAAQQLQDAYEQNHDDAPARDKPIFEPHEKVPGPDIGQGPGAHLDAGNAFADLIRAAQNPAELGLVASQPALPEADAMLQLAAKVDFADQSFGPHGDLHAAAASTPSFADSPVEQHAFAAPVLEHIQIGHH